MVHLLSLVECFIEGAIAKTRPPALTLPATRKRLIKTLKSWVAQNSNEIFIPRVSRRIKKMTADLNPKTIDTHNEFLNSTCWALALVFSYRMCNRLTPCGLAISAPSQGSPRAQQAACHH
jgi:hypothetical protein